VGGAIAGAPPHGRVATRAVNVLSPAP